MAPPRKKPPTPDAGRAEVDACMATLEHLLKTELAALRLLILAADPTIAEGIKWNAPSFRTTDWFATFNLRSTADVQLILHVGARVKELGDLAIDDPAGLLKWLARDRALLRCADLAAIDRQRPAITALLRAWIAVLA